MKPITFKKAIKDLDRTLYCDEEVLKNAPNTLSEGTVEFFKIGKYISDNDLEKEYESRGLTPASLADLIKYDKTNRKEMDEMEYVATHWKNDGWCYAAFGGWFGERRVRVDRGDRGWLDRWWFAGVRKSLSTQSSKPLSDSSLTLGTLSVRLEKLEKFVQGIKELL